MGLSRPNQQLRRELQEIARLGDEAAHAVGMVALALPDEQAAKLMLAAGLMYDCVDRTKALADRVKAGAVATT